MPRPNILASRLRDIIHPFILLLTKSRVRFQVTWEQPPAPLMDKPVIFAVNHTNSFDGPIAAKAISRVFDRRCNFLVGKQRLWFSDKLWIFLYGAIWVDRTDPSDMVAIKDTIIAYLRLGQSIIWFPEGTWNLTDNLLMLPMKWGIVDVASKAGAQIVPVVLDYDRIAMTCRVNFGMPITPDETTDKANAIRELRDTMSTLRWELWEKQTPLKRDEIDRVALKEEMLFALQEYPPLDWDYEQSIIFQPYTSPQEVFAHLEHLIPSRENAFLWNRRYHNSGKQ